jgi:type III pantothenate kinase
VLLLDVGNSRCKWARIENGEWTHKGVADNAECLALQRNFDVLSAPSRIIISNVGGDAMAQRLRNICSKWPVPMEFVLARKMQCGVSNAYDDPARLGSDRWAALIAAWQHFGHACLVVNCGTATTVDALSDAGEFLGGLIVPGVTLMQQSLLHNAAQLQAMDGSVLDFPRNTADAIHSGIVRATAGTIEHQYALLKSCGSAATIACVLSGGAAGQIQKYLGMPVKHVDNLVLEGLKVIGETSAC